jgi:hypothetical protein
VGVAASAHACFAFGSGGFLESLFGQVGFVRLAGGGLAAVVGTLPGGRSSEGFSAFGASELAFDPTAGLVFCVDRGRPGCGGLTGREDR